MNDDAIFLPVHLETKPTNNFSSLELSARATELDLLPMSNSSTSKITSYTGWAKENFPNHFSPKILAHVKNGFVQRLVGWDKPEGSPLFDFSYLAGIKRIPEISDESSGRNSDVYHGHCRTWHPNGVLAMESDHCWAKYSYSAGQTDGPFHKWHTNSKIWLTGKNMNGKIHGILSEYNEDGFRVFKNMYQDGREIWSHEASGH